MAVLQHQEVLKGSIKDDRGVSGGREDSVLCRDWVICGHLRQQQHEAVYTPTASEAAGEDQSCQWGGHPGAISPRSDPSGITSTRVASQVPEGPGSKGAVCRESCKQNNWGCRGAVAAALVSLTNMKVEL